MARFLLLRKILKIALFLGFLTLISALAAGYYFLKPILADLSDVHSLQNAEHHIPLKIYSHDRLLIARFGEKKRTLIKINEVPRPLIQAFLAAEDDRFYEHPGIDYQGFFRASRQLELTVKPPHVATPITMQVVRNFLLSAEKTYVRKIKEIILALQLEKAFSKDEILEFYLNKIYLGQHSYGIIAAAETYFGKALKDLPLAELALIAGLPKAPSVYNPVTNPERAMQRRNYVLKRMYELHFISASEFQTALHSPIKLLEETPPSERVELEAPYIAEMVRQELIKQYGEEAVYSEGFNVYTTIQSDLQKNAAQALRSTLHQYDERHGYRIPTKQPNYSAKLSDYLPIGDTYPVQIIGFGEGELKAIMLDQTPITVKARHYKWVLRSKRVSSLSKILSVNDIVRVRKLNNNEWALCQIPKVEGAFVALNPGNGAILALEGGFDFLHSKYNRATQSKRQPGSGFKPIIYTTALENGFSPSSVVVDSPVAINGWRPENFGHRFYGPTTLRDALKKSRNIVAVKLLMATGIKKAAATAMRFGFESEDIPRSYSMALGSGQASPLQMASMYSVYANNGNRVKPYFIERIEDHNGKVIFAAPKPKAQRVISPVVNYLMNSMLRDVIQSGTATRAKALGRSDLAGKTGTTNDGKDVWFNGYSATISATAWLGFDTPISLGSKETGADAALPMWMSFMREALKGVPQKPLVPPKGVAKVYVSTKSGGALPKEAKGGIWEFFDEQSKPKPAPISSKKTTKPKDKTTASKTGTAPASSPATPQQRQSIESLF